MSGRRVALRLDHASVAVGDLRAAVEHLDRRLGLRATVTPQAPERHSRVYLHRSYVEVSTAGPAGGRWAATMFFLRFDDPVALRTHLDDNGLAYRFGGYEGVDGTWDDVEIHAGPVPLPTLIRRTAPRDIARDWPPALADGHRCGARTLAAVHLEVPSLDEAVPAYRRLLGAGEALPGAGDERSLGGRTRLRLDAGEIVMREGDPGGIVGLEFGVPSLATTRDALEGRLGRADEGVAWLDPEEAFGLRLGFAELEPAQIDSRNSTTACRNSSATATGA